MGRGGSFGDLVVGRARGGVGSFPLIDLIDSCAIEVERMKQMQQVSLRYAEIASQQVSGDDLG